MPASHLLKPHSYEGHALSLSLAQWHVSAFGLILVLCNGGCEMKDAYDRGRCKDLLNGIFMNLVGDFSIMLKPFEYPDLQCSLADGDEFRVIQRRVVAGPAQPSHHALASILGKDIVDVLLEAYRARKESPWLLRKIVSCVGWAIEVHHSDKQWPTNVGKCLQVGIKRKRQERSVKQAIGDLPMAVVRNQWRAGKLLSALGFSGFSHQAWVDTAYCRRYLFALRLGMPSLSYSHTCDKSQGSGKTWLSGVVFGYESARGGYAASGTI